MSTRWRDSQIPLQQGLLEIWGRGRFPQLSSGWSVCAVQSVRQKLFDELTKINKDRDWSFILHQIGECPQLDLADRAWPAR